MLLHNDTVASVDIYMDIKNNKTTAVGQMKPQLDLCLMSDTDLLEDVRCCLVSISDFHNEYSPDLRSISRLAQIRSRSNFEESHSFIFPPSPSTT